MDLETDFNFLIVSQLTGNNPENDRKNLFYTIKWLCEEFANDKDVGIVLKTNSGRNTSMDRAICSKVLNQLVAEVRQGPYPKIHFLHGTMTQRQMASLYRHPKIKAFVSLTRGEGFGLPLLEAAASALPIIATNWSGHLDFLSLGKFIPLDYEMTEIDESRVDGKIFMKGSKWAKVDESDVKKKFRKFKESWFKPTKWAEELRPKILKNYSQEAVSEIYDSVLGEYLR